MLFDPTLKILCFEVHFILICIAFFSFSEELYQQMLAKALAHYFESKLLLLDVNDFSLKVTFTALIFLNFKLWILWYSNTHIYHVYLSTDAEQIWLC